jgi:peroxiredoxin
VVAETEASVDSIQSIIKKLVDQYKDDVTKNYIFKEPMKAYSYFALFQYITVGRQSSLIFNPRENPEDVKVFGAVATSWDTYYPDSERGKNLHNIAIEGMKDQRIVQANNQQLVIDESKVSDAGLFNITLIDNKGQQRSLTDLKGKVVMLDFHLFSVGEESTKRIMQLRDLYNKYHAQGFEIYQISLDSNEHFWKTQTQHLPWVSVYDPDGMNSDNLMKYNVQSLPTFFLIDKNNVLQKRDVQINDIDAEIRSML